MLSDEKNAKLVSKQRTTQPTYMDKIISKSAKYIHETTIVTEKMYLFYKKNADYMLAYKFIPNKFEVHASNHKTQ